MTFEGTAAAINAALNGASFAPTASYSGDATVALVTNDLGNTGGGALSDSDTIHIQVGASRFQEGSGGYVGTQDTYVQDTTFTTAYGTASTVLVDDGRSRPRACCASTTSSATASGRSFGATITSASLSFYVTNHGAADTVYLHRMLTNWSEASTWNSLTAGIQTDGVEAASSALLSFSAGVSG